MNKVQKNYMLAKAHEETIKSILDEMEAEYIKTNNINNTDGTIPSHLWSWDIAKDTEDEIVFAAIDDFYATPKIAEIEKEHIEAEELLRTAENALIAFGISLAPEFVRPSLQKGCNHWKHRDELIRITLSLDTKTLPKSKMKKVLV